MNNKIAYVLTFVAGAAIGYFVTRKMLEAKYAQIADEEIASVKEVWAQMDKERAEKEEYESKAAEYNSAIVTEEKIIEVKEVDALISPRVISPDEYGDNEYDIANYTYYADGILADEYDEVVEDVDETVGSDFASHFGDYNDVAEDTVFIRNDGLRMDFEINKDTRTYSEVCGQVPPVKVSE